MQRLFKITDELEKLKILQHEANQPYSLDVIKKFAEFTGNPQDELKIIHVTGSAGKGSTSKFISAALQKHGFKVGLFTSPHVYSIYERISVNDQNITHDKYLEYFERVKDFQKSFFKINKQILNDFEFIFCMALLYFNDIKVDYAVIEVGIGARLDPTNIINSIASSITNIALDHQDLLGQTVEDIARDKMHILKKDSVLFTCVEQKSIQVIIKDYADKQNSNIYILKENFDFKNINFQESFSVFDLNFFDDKNYYTIKTLFGEFQIKNTALALNIVKYVLKEKFDIYKVNDLSDVVIPGRFEFFDNKLVLGGFPNFKKIIPTLESFKLLANNSKHKIFIYLDEYNQKIIKNLQDNFNIEDVVVYSKSFINNLQFYQTNNQKEFNEQILSAQEECDYVLVTGLFFIIKSVRNFLIDNNSGIK